MKTTLKMKAIARVVALASVGAALSGCVYDVGLGYASDGYYDDAYGCDPYSDYERYYDCDYGHGFNNIGYGGGWYDHYYYPGYGFFLFDNIGRRYPMRDHHRRYWGERRYSWYRENRGRDGDGGRYQRRNPRFTDGATPGAIARPERYDRRMNDVQRPREGHREGRRSRDDQWRGRDGYGRPDRRPRGSDADAMLRQRPPQNNAGQEPAPVARPAPEPRAPRQPPARQRAIEGAVEQPQ